MTWVVGMPGLPAGGLLVGDVRVTVGGEPQPVRVQKIHAIAPWIAAGFAGPVWPGLRLMEDVRAWLGLPEVGTGLRPGRVAWHWSRRLRFLWGAWLPNQYRDYDLELLLLGAGPSTPPFQQTHGWVMRSPYFTLEPIPPLTAAGIGTGKETYAAALAKIAEIPEGPNPGLLGVQIGSNPEASAWVLATLMASSVEQGEPPSRDVSPETHTAFIRQGFVAVSDNEALVYKEDRPLPVRTIGSVVASSAEFEVRARALGFAAAAALG